MTLDEDNAPIRQVPDAVRRAWERKPQTTKEAAAEAVERHRERKTEHVLRAAFCAADWPIARRIIRERDEAEKALEEADREMHKHRYLEAHKAIQRGL